MKRLLVILIILLVGYNIFLMTTYVRLNDIFFISDIARDMYLLDEIKNKIFILIGPRSSVGGLFHGPLWAYITYPGFAIGNGNPVTVGWYWIFLIILFLAGNYFIAKKLFGMLSALIFSMVMSTYLVFHAHELFNPYGALFFIPLYYFLFVRYTETKNVIYLILHIFTAGLLIQFQMAVGMPLTILSFIASVWVTVKNRKFLHLLSFFVLLIPLSTFILFDIRHDYLLTKNVFRHLQTSDNSGLLSIITDRIKNFFYGTEFIYGKSYLFQLIFTCFTIIMTLVQIKTNSKRNTYLIFLYFYTGFFILSVINRYNLLTFYVFPVYSLIFLIFSSFADSRYRFFSLVVFSSFYILNMIAVSQFISQAPNEANTSKFHWKSLYDVARKVYSGGDTTFGYFVYAPDIMGYGPRYAMDYVRQTTSKKVYSFSKQPVTYLVLEPFPGNKATSAEIFRLYQVHIYKKPVEVEKFPNGYIIEKYLLTKEETEVPFEPGINPGLFYR